MRKSLTVLMAVLFLTFTLPAQAVVECPNPDRPIHYPPFCLTEAEFMELSAPRSPAVVPGTTGKPLVDRWLPLVVKYWPAERVPWAMAIINCESGGNEWADNPTSTAAGLFQFLRSTWDKGPAPALGLPAYWTGAPYVPEWNIQAAAWLYANWGGKSQWSCKSSL